MILQMLFAGIGSVTFCFMFNMRGYNILLAGLAGSVAYGVYLVARPYDKAIAALLASAVLALASELLARRRKVPATLFLVSGLIPLVPGGGMFRCAMQAVEGDTMQALETGADTLLEAGAIAVGIIAVTSLFTLWPSRRRKQPKL